MCGIYASLTISTNQKSLSENAIAASWKFDLQLSGQLGDSDKKELLDSLVRQATSAEVSKTRQRDKQAEQLRARIRARQMAGGSGMCRTAWGFCEFLEWVLRHVRECDIVWCCLKSLEWVWCHVMECYVTCGSLTSRTGVWLCVRSSEVSWVSVMSGEHFYSWLGLECNSSCNETFSWWYKTR